MAKERYIEGIGRRKTASARVRITPAKKTVITVNDKDITEHFSNEVLQNTVTSVFGADETIGTYDISVHVKGGGLSSQAESIRLGIARALVKEQEDRRTSLKKLGFLKRDPRAKERKKFGLLKARKRPQWSKR